MSWSAAPADFVTGLRIRMRAEKINYNHYFFQFFDFLKKNHWESKIRKNKRNLHFKKHGHLTISIPQVAMFFDFWYFYFLCKFIILKQHMLSENFWWKLFFSITTKLYLYSKYYVKNAQNIILDNFPIICLYQKSVDYLLLWCICYLAKASYVMNSSL